MSILKKFTFITWKTWKCQNVLTQEVSVLFWAGNWWFVHRMVQLDLFDNFYDISNSHSAWSRQVSQRVKLCVLSHNLCFSVQCDNGDHQLRLDSRCSNCKFIEKFLHKIFMIFLISAQPKIRSDCFHVFRHSLDFIFDICHWNSILGQCRQHHHCSLLFMDSILVVRKFRVTNHWKVQSFVLEKTSLISQFITSMHVC